MSIPGKIIKLDEVVVNRIAAGEVIQRPANALKELIENSLDAKSTNIQVIAKEGGLKLLQIQDNGTGIRRDDMEIVCERFTTSKLRKFDDLKAISTFGFRGEALASISHVALLAITTKTSDEKCAYKANYINGKLKAPPKTCAGNQGTTIVIENLFYNVATRRKALSSPSEEFIKILEVVMRYSVHNPMVGFTLKKHGETSPQVRTPHSSTKINNVRMLYGNPIARELLEVELDDKDYKFKMHALVTNPSYSGKRIVLLVFINNRLVDSTSIRKMLEELYSIYLPKKSYPWCYISLDINPCNIDVNVHPTKHEVKFLHEDSIIERVRCKLDEKLSTHSASKTVYLQTRLPQTNINSQILKKVLPEYDEDNRDKSKKIYQHEMVRSNSLDQKLDKFNFTVEIIDKHSSNPAHVENSMIESPKERECCIDSTSNNEEVSIQYQGLTDVLRVNETKHVASSTISVNKVDSLILPEISAQCTEQTDLKIIDNFLEEASLEESDLENNFLCKQPDNNLPPQKIQKECVDIIADKARKRVYQYFGNKNEEKAGTSGTISPKKKKLGMCNDEKSETTISSDTHKNECIEIKDTVPKDQSTLSQFKSYSVNNFRREVKLTSVLKLRKEVEDSFHEGLREILSNLIFVGCVNDTSTIVQSGVNLYICDTKRLAEELFYEIMLYDFANYGVIKFAEPLSLYELALLGLDTAEAGWTEEDGKKEDLATSVKELLLEKTDMMKEYFSIVIDKKGFLKSLPILLDKYFPYEAGLPLYIVRLATEVDWTTEQLCFRNICRETAKYYSEMNPIHNTHDWKHITEHVLYPAIKDSLLPPKQFSHDSTILQIASLPDLYKIFERC